MSHSPFWMDVDPFDYPFLRFYRPSFDHHFGLGIHPEQLKTILHTLQKLRQSLEELEKDAGSGKGTLNVLGKDGFQVNLDVQQFKPNEISVKTQEDTLIIEGKHDERQDRHGYISRHFTRKYVLPKEVDAAHLASSLSSDGILTVKAPKVKSIDEGERNIQIQQTGPARESIKENITDAAEE